MKVLEVTFSRVMDSFEDLLKGISRSRKCKRCNAIFSGDTALFDKNKRGTKCPKCKKTNSDLADLFQTADVFTMLSTYGEVTDGHVIIRISDAIFEEEEEEEETIEDNNEEEEAPLEHRTHNPRYEYVRKLFEYTKEPLDYSDILELLKPKKEYLSLAELIKYQPSNYINYYFGIRSTRKADKYDFRKINKEYAKKRFK